MGSSHADFSDEIVNALKGSPPVFKHFPPHVPMVSGPTTKTLSQHLSWQKQTRSDKNFSKDIVAALKEPLDGDQSNRKEISQGKSGESYEPPTIAPYQGSVTLKMRSEAKRRYSKRRKASNVQQESYQTYVTTVRTEKPKRWKKKRKSSGGEIVPDEKTLPKLLKDSRPVKGDKSLSDGVAGEIVRELKRPQSKSKTGSDETKKEPVSGWMTVEPLKIGPQSKGDTFKLQPLAEVNIKEIDTLGAVASDQNGPSSTVESQYKIVDGYKIGPSTMPDPRPHQNFDESVWEMAQATRTGSRYKQTSHTKPTMAPYQGTPSPAFTEPSDLLLKIRDNFNESVWTTRARPTMGPYQGTRSPAFTGQTSTGMWKNNTQWPIRKRDNVVVMKSDSSLKSIIRNGLSDGVTTLRNGLTRTNLRVRSQAKNRLRNGVESLWTGLKNGVKNGMELGTRTLRRAFTPRITIRRPVRSGSFVETQDVQFTEQLDTTPLLLLRWVELK